MARSTCIKCEGNRFEMVEYEPVKSAYKYMFIQCAGCGGVVGVVDYFNVSNLIHKLATALRIKL